MSFVTLEHFRGNEIWRSISIASLLQYHWQKGTAFKVSEKYPTVNIIFWNIPHGNEASYTTTTETIFNETAYTCARKIYKTAEDLITADVIIFSPVLQWPHARLRESQRDVLRQMHSRKLFVFSQHESPAFRRPDCLSPTCISLAVYDNFINATKTYRMDSTYPVAYGYADAVSNRLRESDNISTADPLPVTKRHNKIRGAVAMISNCRSSRRNVLITRLSELVRWPNGTRAIEVYGKCAKKLSIMNDTPNPILARPRAFDPEGRQKQKEALKQYKFYLSFENSQCKDYISEKFFSNGLASGLVPVVHGTKRSEYEQHFPGGAFMHVDDYNTVEQLAERINYYLRPENEKEYLEFFDWYTLSSSDLARYGPHRDPFDRLCVDGFLARNGRLDMPAIPDLSTWWYGEREHISEEICKLEGPIWY